MLSGQIQNPIIEEKMRIRTIERVNITISKVNMRDGSYIWKTLSIEARFALNRAKRVFQSKEVQCSLRREKTRGVRVDHERGRRQKRF